MFTQLKLLRCGDKGMVWGREFRHTYVYVFYGENCRVRLQAFPAGAPFWLCQSAREGVFIYLKRCSLIVIWQGCCRANRWCCSTPRVPASWCTIVNCNAIIFWHILPLQKLLSATAQPLIHRPVISGNSQWLAKGTEDGEISGWVWAGTSGHIRQSQQAHHRVSTLWFPMHILCHFIKANYQCKLTSNVLKFSDWFPTSHDSINFSTLWNPTDWETSTSNIESELPKYLMKEPTGNHTDMPFVIYWFIIMSSMTVLLSSRMDVFNCRLLNPECRRMNIPPRKPVLSALHYHAKHFLKSKLYVHSNALS